MSLKEGKLYYVVYYTTGDSMTVFQHRDVFVSLAVAKAKLKRIKDLTSVYAIKQLEVKQLEYELNLHEKIEAQEILDIVK